jgi:hypothetical protein
MTAGTVKINFWTVKMTAGTVKVTVNEEIKFIPRISKKV